MTTLYLDLHDKSAKTREEHIQWILANCEGVKTRKQAERVFDAVLDDGQIVPIWSQRPEDLVPYEPPVPNSIPELAAAFIALLVFAEFFLPGIY